MVSNPNTENQPWYNKRWLVVLLCVVFFPIGFYALWKNETLGRGWKIGIVAFVWISIAWSAAKNRGSDDEGPGPASEEELIEWVNNSTWAYPNDVSYLDIVENGKRINTVYTYYHFYDDNTFTIGNIKDSTFAPVDHTWKAGNYTVSFEKGEKRNIGTIKFGHAESWTITSKNRVAAFESAFKADDTDMSKYGKVDIISVKRVPTPKNLIRRGAVSENKLEEAPDLLEEAPLVPQEEAPYLEIFSGCSSIRLTDVLGHWVSHVSECGFDGSLWISADKGKVSFSGWEWSGTVVASQQGADRTTVQLKVYSEGEPSLMQVEMGMRNGKLVLDPVFRRYCFGDGESALVKCPTETSGIDIGIGSGEADRPEEPTPTPVPEEPIFDQSSVQEQPEFPGGVNAMYLYLGRNIEYPKAERDAGVQGKVYVEFVVSSTGAITNATVKRGVSSGLDAEALRVVKAMPDWTPGKLNGKPVRVRYILPVSFALR